MQKIQLTNIKTKQSPSKQGLSGFIIFRFQPVAATSK